jgi:hypothetical protein
MEIEFHFNNNEVEIIHFPLFIGHGDVLVVKDERDVFHSEQYYLDILDSLGYRASYWDILVNGNPTSGLLSAFPCVIWYTGFDEDNTVSALNQQSLIEYLDQGGKLFLTGQNISDELAGSQLLTEYLHCDHSQDVTNQSVVGNDFDPVGYSLDFYLNGGDGLSNQYAQSKLVPVNGGIECFSYGITSNAAGIRFENDVYKTVFLGFGFEGIDLTENRYTLMERIMQYFDIYVGNDDERNHQAFIADFTIMPNPAYNCINVICNSIFSGEITVDIYDLQGTKLFSKTQYLNSSGNDRISINLANFKAGLYLLDLKATGIHQTSKIQVVR